MLQFSKIRVSNLTDSKNDIMSTLAMRLSVSGAVKSKRIIHICIFCRLITTKGCDKMKVHKEEHMFCEFNNKTKITNENIC